MKGSGRYRKDTGRQKIGQKKSCQICAEKFKGEMNKGERTSEAEKRQKGGERGGRSLVTRAGECQSVHHRGVDPGPWWRRFRE